MKCFHKMNDTVFWLHHLCKRMTPSEANFISIKRSCSFGFAIFLLSGVMGVRTTVVSEVHIGCMDFCMGCFCCFGFTGQLPKFHRNLTHRQRSMAKRRLSWGYRNRERPKIADYLSVDEQEQLKLP